MDEIKRPIQLSDIGITTGNIENSKYPYFKGLDGKDYSDPQAMQRANQEWMKQDNKYISPWTGREYTDYSAMHSDEKRYWEEQMKPGNKIIKEIKIK